MFRVILEPSAESLNFYFSAIKIIEKIKVEKKIMARLQLRNDKFSNHSNNSRKRIRGKFN